MLVLFDLNGTLLDPGDRRDVLMAAVRLAWVHTMAGEFRPLAELLAAAGGGEPPEEMPPFPDVPPGLASLRREGHALAVLTNSARATAEQHLAGAGLREAFDTVIGADEIGAYKPDRRTYAHALDRLGAAPDRTWFVAAHDWDMVGAAAAGLRTAYLDRGGPAPVSVAPDRTITALPQLRDLE